MGQRMFQLVLFRHRKKKYRQKAESLFKNRG
jgi:hypothetical protein